MAEDELRLFALGEMLLAIKTCLRRSISSAYYCAYCAVTSELVAQGSILHMAGITRHMSKFRHLDFERIRLFLARSRYQINRAIRRLRMAREDADYRAQHVLIDRKRTLDCIHDALDVLQLLEHNRRLGTWN